ncbi:MAG TPA: hypothetical protein VLA84_01315 [Microcoleus sp.]|nr:hypothetical protein [Microcoleus sp.]
MPLDTSTLYILSDFLQHTRIPFTIDEQNRREMLQTICLNKTSGGVFGTCCRH